MNLAVRSCLTVRSSQLCANVFKYHLEPSFRTVIDTCRYPGLVLSKTVKKQT